MRCLSRVEAPSLPLFTPRGRRSGLQLEPILARAVEARKLSGGEYEVHNIGVNWPHHIFVNQNFKVVGAD
jgi:hypothetical protein